jgi:hypothetical protein
MKLIFRAKYLALSNPEPTTLSHEIDTSPSLPLVYESDDQPMFRRKSYRFTVNFYLDEVSRKPPASFCECPRDAAKPMKAVRVTSPIDEFIRLIVDFFYANFASSRCKD